MHPATEAAAVDGQLEWFQVYGYATEAEANYAFGYDDYPDTLAA